MRKFDIYTDGSFSTSNMGVTYGAYIILENDKPLIAQRLSIVDPKMTKMRNVGGELAAVVIGLVKANEEILRLDKSDEPYTINLYFDYQGIEKFDSVVGSWKPKESGSIAYKAYMSALRQRYPRMCLHFIWVRGHNGNKWNEVADTVANGIVPDSSFLLNNILLSELHIDDF